MDRNTQDLIAKFICYGIGLVAAYYVFLYLIPYVVMFLALIGAGYIYHEYQRSKRGRRR